MDGFRFEATDDYCFMVGCLGRSPYVAPENPKPVSPPVKPVHKAICALDGCADYAAPNRKYCSDRCRKRYARRAYRKRLRGG